MEEGLYVEDQQPKIKPENNYYLIELIISCNTKPTKF